MLTSLKKKEDESEEPVNENEEITENNTTTRHTYAGMMAIDFGTTNSVVVVRDPLYAAEDIKESLTKEQYDALFTWLDSWLIQHISASQSTPEDAYINKLINETFNLNTVSGGTFSVDIWQTLQQILLKFNF